MTTSLHDEVIRFKEWASVHGGTSGEWECDYEHWDALWSAAEASMASCCDHPPPEKVTNDLLYTIARDNEIEWLRNKLVEHPGLLRHLARCAVESSDTDARWQIVVSVADAGFTDAAELIRPYLDDGDEYVRRRSLLAIAPFSPAEAEAIAKKWMDDTYEYSRIAGIHVLYSINSESVDFYLEKHANDPSQHVRSNVEDISQRRRNA